MSSAAGIAADPAAADAPAARPGRPRDADLEQRVFAAVLELLRERPSLREVTTRAIAQRAGAGLGAIYRRWTSREELIVAALNSLRPPVRFQPTGDFVEDVLGILEITGTAYSPEQLEVQRIRIQLGLLDRTIRRISTDRHTGHRRRLLLETIDRGVATGQVRLTIPADDLADALIGAMTYRYLSDARPDVSLEATMRSLLSLVTT